MAGFCEGSSNNDSRITCEQCSFSVEFQSGFLFVHTGYVRCPDDHVLFGEKCEYCSGDYRGFIRDKNRILCVQCDYVLKIYKSTPKGKTCGLHVGLNDIPAETICCVGCCNKNIRKFEVVPVDEDLVWIRCETCAREQLIFPDKSDARNYEHFDAAKPKLSTGQTIWRGVDRFLFQTFWKYAAGNFGSVAEKVLSKIPMGPTPKKTAQTVVTLVDMLLKSKEAGETIDEILGKVVPFLAEKVLDIVITRLAHS